MWALPAFKGLWNHSWLHFLTEMDGLHEFKHGWHACCYLAKVDSGACW